MATLTKPLRRKRAMQVPLLDLKPQYQPLAGGDPGGHRQGVRQPALHPRARPRGARGGVAAYCQCRFGIGVSSGTDALLRGADGARDRGRGRGHHQPVHVLRHRRHDRAQRARGRSSATSIRRRSTSRPPRSRHSSSEQCVERGGQLVQSTTPADACKALMPVHLYGQVADMAPFMQICARASDSGSSKTQRRRSASADAEQAARMQFRRRGLSVVLSDQEPRRLRRCRHVRHQRRRAGRAHRDPARARRQAQVLPPVHRRQLPHR